jgi:hypothetical protein
LVQAKKNKFSALDHLHPLPLSSQLDPNFHPASPTPKKDEGWEDVDPLCLETYFIRLKNIGNSTPLESNINGCKIKSEIPEIPPRDKIPTFIKNYVPELDDFKME